MSDIDWDFWKHKTKVELWQAACLSCNVNPDSQKKMYQRYGKSHYGTRNEKITKRLELLIDNLHLSKFFTTQNFKSSSPSFQTVILSEFVKWCFHIGYDIPKELKDLSKRNSDAGTGKHTEKSWHIPDPNDPEPEQPWYTPARYFARQLVAKDTILLIKRKRLADKVSASLKNAGIYKRGGKLPPSPVTVLKALSNVNLG